MGHTASDSKLVHKFSYFLKKFCVLGHLHVTWKFLIWLQSDLFWFQITKKSFNLFRKITNTWLRICNLLLISITNNLFHILDFSNSLFYLLLFHFDFSLHSSCSLLQLIKLLLKLKAPDFKLFLSFLNKYFALNNMFEMNNVCLNALGLLWHVTNSLRSLKCLNILSFYFQFDCFLVVFLKSVF